MGRPGETCRLCGVNEVCKLESHVIPKLMTFSMRKDVKDRLLFNIHFDKQSIVETKKDSPKETYLLCKSCESDFLSGIEREFSNNFHNPLRNNDDISNSTIAFQPGSSIYAPLTANKTITALLIYSIIFRCHVCSVWPFEQFSLNKSEFRRLRDILRPYAILNGNKVKDHVRAIGDCEILPFKLITCSKLSKPENNLIGVLPKISEGKRYTFLIGEYLLEISFTDKRKHFLSGPINIQESKAVSTLLINEDVWLRDIIQPLTELNSFHGLALRKRMNLPIPKSLLKVK